MGELEDGGGFGLLGEFAIVGLVIGPGSEIAGGGNAAEDVGATGGEGFVFKSALGDVLNTSDLARRVASKLDSTSSEKHMRSIVLAGRVLGATGLLEDATINLNTGHTVAGGTIQTSPILFGEPIPRPPAADQPNRSGVHRDQFLPSGNALNNLFDGEHRT